MRPAHPPTAAPRRAIAILGAGLLTVSATACSTGTPGADLTPTRIAAATTSSSTPPPTSTTAPTTSATRSTPTTTTRTKAAAPATTAPARPRPSARPKPASQPNTAPTPKPATKAKPTPRPKPAPRAKPAPKREPAPVIILRPGNNGSTVRSLQARLKQIRWFSGDITDYYGSRTTTAVKGFQVRRGYPATGILDERTWQRLLGMSRTPTKDELDNVKPKPPAAAAKKRSGGFAWDADQRCLTGRVMCISKSTNRLTWVVGGIPQYGFDVRFGSEQLPTREGTFAVTWKKVDVISNLYHTPMPYSLFFSGGQAVHYSSNFARLGYNGSSHGCVNVRDWNGIVRLYNESRVGDKVVVHW